MTRQTILELKAKGRNREIVNGVRVEELDPRNEQDEEVLLEVAWAYHQLGEYGQSIPIMEVLRGRHAPNTEVGESARRGLAHGLLQRDGDIMAADTVFHEIPPGSGRDNGRMNMMIVAARQGTLIPPGEVMATICGALEKAPYGAVIGHIVNNGVMALYEARKQESARIYSAVLPGLMHIALGIYHDTKTARNHVAGAEYRAALICADLGGVWLNYAANHAVKSCLFWKELVASQGGERYKKNLASAMELQDRLLR